MELLGAKRTDDRGRFAVDLSPKTASIVMFGFRPLPDRLRDVTRFAM
jgi:hypothetical protein